MEKKTFDPNQTIKDFIQAYAVDQGLPYEPVYAEAVAKLNNLGYGKLNSLASVKEEQLKEWKIPPALISHIMTTTPPPLNESPQAEKIAETSLKMQVLAKQQAQQYLSSHVVDKNSKTLIRDITELVDQNINTIDSSWQTINEFCVKLGLAIYPELASRIETYFKEIYVSRFEDWLKEVQALITNSIYWSWSGVHPSEFKLFLVFAGAGLIQMGTALGIEKGIEWLNNRNNISPSEVEVLREQLRVQRVKNLQNLIKKVNEKNMINPMEEGTFVINEGENFSFKGSTKSSLSEGSIKTIAEKWEAGFGTKIAANMAGLLIMYGCIKIFEWADSKISWSLKDVKTSFPEILRSIIAQDENTSRFLVSYDLAMVNMIKEVCKDSHCSA